MAAVATLAIIATAGHAGEAVWVVKPGSVFCPNYFELKDAEAAAAAGDGKWLAETGCTIASTRSNVVRAIIDGNTNDPADAWRVRVGGGEAGETTVYVLGRSIATWLPEGGWQTYPCRHGGSWRCTN